MTGNETLVRRMSVRNRGGSKRSRRRIAEVLRIVAVVPLSAMLLWTNPGSMATLWTLFRVGVQCVLSPVLNVWP
jgi:hypothetical protein